MWDPGVHDLKRDLERACVGREIVSFVTEFGRMVDVPRGIGRRSGRRRERYSIKQNERDITDGRVIPFSWNIAVIKNINVDRI